jgi:hypothetical protein
MIRSGIAAVVLAGLLALATVNLNAMNFATLPVHRCVAWQARMDAPAADVMFVGTSRTGAGIDPAYIGAKLSQDRGVLTTADRLITWRSDMVHLNLMVRDYLAHRRAPKVAVIELTYLPIDERGPQNLHAPALEPRSYHFANPSYLRDLVAELNGRTGLSFMKSEISFVAAFASNKLAVSLYHFVRQPLDILENSATVCAPERRAQTEGPRNGLVFASVGDADPATAKPFEPKLKAPPPLGDPAYMRAYDTNLYENRLFENTVQLLKAAGVEKVIFARLARYPNTPLDEAPMTGLPRVSDDVAFVDVAAVLPEDRRVRMSQQYRDMVHLAPNGARDLSDFMAEYLRPSFEILQ